MTRDSARSIAGFKLAVLPILFAIAVWLSATNAVLAQADVQGQWRTLPYVMPINPIHIALLNTGKVLVVVGSGNVATETNFQAAVWDPGADTITTQPVSWDMFCNGMVALPD